MGLSDSNGIRIRNHLARKGTPSHLVSNSKKISYTPIKFNNTVELVQLESSREFKICSNYINFRIIGLQIISAKSWKI